MLYLNSIDSFVFCISEPNLTLTSVVFEFYKTISKPYFYYNLTLTSVVFEYNQACLPSASWPNLTLTSVVFE